MKIGFLGAGAIGGYFGGILAQAGHEVGFVARGETLQTLRTTGLTLIDADDKETILPGLLAAETFAELKDLLGGLDVAIIASKALPGNATFGPDPESLAGIPVVTTHNSVEIPYLAADLFGEENVLAGVARVYATRLGAAKVKRNPGPLSLAFGPMVPGTLPQGQALASALNDAGARGKFHPTPLVDVWAKAMFVTTTGTLGALVDKPIGYLCKEIPEQLDAFMREVETVGRAMGVELPEKVVEETMGFARQQYPEATSSMQRDIKDRLPNELDAQVGAIRRMGQRAGVVTPLFDFAQDVLEAQLRN
ncbi:2-dehydropantoate 2-reductase [Corynebacterium striatum]|uniref:2-dehydropantoate 2-reductase n=1 Tax=Corynebacterium striatum TaxID=43770 RepID=UPI00254B8926|nr:2-dehydropantoate 2-reductase [Corynebacterium striatum]MDK8806697.1 2-dehydropantoate 2-reductase [Corynebacterium striatum]MDK8825008.1 2-dehydropantoate 2-reductase [Corynebacterium striatum]